MTHHPHSLPQSVRDGSDAGAMATPLAAPAPNSRGSLASQAANGERGASRVIPVNTYSLNSPGPSGRGPFPSLTAQAAAAVEMAALEGAYAFLVHEGHPTSASHLAPLLRAARCRSMQLGV